jgi:two-component system cell cycle response regulator
MRIILAEDDSIARRLLESRLGGWGYAVQSFADGRAAWAHLERATEPTLVILDWMMPGLDGLEICRRLRAQAREPYVYVIMITGRADRQDIVEALKAGADDFMVKPVDKDELKARVNVGERIVRLQTELVDARQAMMELATTDSLTRLPNRSAILTMLAKEINRAGREGTSISVCVADLDHFKRINDTYGHAAGDIVLRDAAIRLQSQLRSYQAVGRLGGEEFLIILPNCDASTSQLVINRARTAVSETPIIADSALIHLTCSFGVTTLSPGVRGDPLALVQTADRALYDAKAKGRDCIGARTFNPSAVANIVAVAV